MWVHSSSYQSLPQNAGKSQLSRKTKKNQNLIIFIVPAGTDSDGTQIFVGRAYHGGEQMAAKVIPSKRACYVAYNGSEVLVQEYEVSHLNLNFFYLES